MCCHTQGLCCEAIYSYFLYVKSVKSSLILYSSAVYCFHLSKFLSFSFISSPALPFLLTCFGDKLYSELSVLNISLGLFLLFFSSKSLHFAIMNLSLPFLAFVQNSLYKCLITVLSCSLLVLFPSLFHNPDSSFSEPFGTFYSLFFLCTHCGSFSVNLSCLFPDVIWIMFPQF